MSRYAYIRGEVKLIDIDTHAKPRHLLAMNENISPKAPKRRKRKPIKLWPLPAPQNSSVLYVKVLPKDVGMFRFLLEARDNLALFTVLDRHGAVLKVMYSPHQEKLVKEALQGMTEVIPIDFL